MLILKGTKTVDLSKDELTEIIGQFDRVHIDLGTGDGRNIYKLAINDQNTFYIGIDPVKENLFDISKKIIKKPSKGGLSNVVFVIAAAESLPFELKNIADSISILFPWGTLLEYVIKPNRDILSNVADLAKKEAHFEFVTTYSDSYEEAEIKKRGLILSRLVDTFFSRISLTMPPAPKSHNTACVLPQEEPLHWQSRSSGYSSS